MIIGLVVLACYIGLRLKPTPAPIPESSKIYPYAIEVSSPEGQVTNFYGDSSSKDYIEIGKQLGVTIYPEDKAIIFPSFYLNLGAIIKIIRAPEVTINDWGKDKLFRSFAPTVGQLIEEKQLELGNDDKVSVDLKTPVVSGMKFKITRVAKTTVVDAKPVDFKTITKKNTSQEKDYKKIITPGIKGTKNYSYLVTREDGVEVSRVLIKTEVVKDPVDQVTEVGTIIKTYGTGVATWYKRSKPLVAASNTLPKGTRVTVVNTSNGKSVVVTVDDTGIQGNPIIDLSSDAFAAIGSLPAGVINVRLEKYYPSL